MLGSAELISALAWEIPWAEEPGKLLSMGLESVGHNWAHRFTRVICRALEEKTIPGHLYFSKISEIILMCI